MVPHLQRTYDAAQAAKMLAKGIGKQTQAPMALGLAGTLSPELARALSEVVAALPGFPVGLEPRWNIAPAQQVLLLRAGAAGREAALVRWGLTPAWLRDLSRSPAQARAETLAEQPLFREAAEIVDVVAIGQAHARRANAGWPISRPFARPAAR